MNPWLPMSPVTPCLTHAKLALASPEHWWPWLAAVSSSVNPPEQEPETLHKLEVTCSREFLTEEQKSVVGGMAECPSPREDTALELLVLAGSGQSHSQGLGHGFGEVT